MNGRSVARLILVCCLSSCYSPPPIVVINPASAPVSPPEGSAGGQYGAGAKEIPLPPPAKDIDGPPFSTPRGNCWQFTTGGSSFCYWSAKTPMCTVPLNDCRNLTGKCATPVTSNPPPC